MLGDLKAIYEIIDKTLEKHRASEEQKIRDKVLIAVFKLGNDGKQSVSANVLETHGGFTKQQIIHSIELAKTKNWIIEAHSHEGMFWCLNQSGIYYIRGLLET